MQDPGTQAIAVHPAADISFGQVVITEIGHRPERP
jgi:hypothetical protein